MFPRVTLPDGTELNPEYVGGMRVFRWRPPALEATAADVDGDTVWTITTLHDEEPE